MNFIVFSHTHTPKLITHVVLRIDTLLRSKQNRSSIDLFLAHDSGKFQLKLNYTLSFGIPIK